MAVPVYEIESIEIMNKRRRRYREKKPMDLKSITVAAPAGVSILYFLICMIYAISADRNIPKMLSAMGTIFFIASFIELFIGFSERKNDEASTWSKRIGIILPIISMLVWASLYALGIINGIK